ncbi:hypothetical protein [Vibrio cyclitrophicus]|uniref:hypothetical protein n=1 Tax=Vibrio cyclitrophicus TaxID=47951 RepID=UPI000C81F095|nr:hypothetical protein [Vibrio cyclitrophicus]PMK95190.1 hypothetical protein BCT87_13085 [Vibrio cyclitrophicus]
MSNKPLSFIEQLLLSCELHKYENFKTLTWWNVVESCEAKGYLAQQDVKQRSPKYQFVEKVFERDYPAMILSVPKIEPASCMDDIARLKRDANELAETIIKDVAKVLMSRVIDSPF